MTPVCHLGLSAPQATVPQVTRIPYSFQEGSETARARMTALPIITRFSGPFSYEAPLTPTGLTGKPPRFFQTATCATFFSAFPR